MFRNSNATSPFLPQLRACQKKWLFCSMAVDSSYFVSLDLHWSQSWTVSSLEDFALFGAVCWNFWYIHYFWESKLQIASGRAQACSNCSNHTCRMILFGALFGVFCYFWSYAHHLHASPNISECRDQTRKWLLWDRPTQVYSKIGVIPWKTFGLLSFEFHWSVWSLPFLSDTYHLFEPSADSRFRFMQHLLLPL